MIPSIGERLCALRAAAGLSQKQAAEKLRERGISVTNQAVSKWETNLTQPNAVQFLALCELYNVRDVLEEFCGKKRRTKLSALNGEGRRRADEYVDLLIASGLFSESEKSGEGAVRCLPLYKLAASAGTGQFIDSDAFDRVEVDASVPQSADFGVHLAGDSMTPRFADGQIVWVKRQEMLNDNEIGVFLYNGDAYCKRLEHREGKVFLVSLNPAYAPIAVDPRLEMRVFGKVVG